MKRRTKIISIVSIIVLIAAMAGLYLHFGPKTQEGAKTVTIEVVDDKEQSEEYTVKTDAEYLVDAMRDAGKEGFTFSGTEKEYGLALDTVNGLKADFNTDSAYWAVYVNDEYGNYGIEEQPVADGDTFRFEYTMQVEE